MAVLIFSRLKRSDRGRPLAILAVGYLVMNQSRTKVVVCRVKCN